MLAGRRTPTSSTSVTVLVAIIRTLRPLRTLPSITRMSATTPRYSSKYESKISAFSGASGSPLGAGTRRTTASSASRTPIPDFALVRTASSAGMARPSSISCRTRSGSAAGRSILLMSGMISSPAFMAISAFATVCASTPCAASTTSSTPSQASSERETS